MSRRLLILSFLLLGLSGCAHHLTQNECQMMNWQQVGFKDGSAGLQPRSLEGSVTDCMKFDIRVDEKGYHTGYKQGLSQYCTPSYNEGMAVGQAGRPEYVVQSRAGICSQHGQPLRLDKFKQGYRKGLLSFCTYDNGRNFGLQGKAAPEVCSGKLRTKFMAGYNSGGNQFCSNSRNGFVFGKSGKPYPATCPASTHMDFKAEYERGRMIRGRISQLNFQIADVNRRISSMAEENHLSNIGNSTYVLGDRQDPQARMALRKIRQLIRQRDELQNELFQAKSIN